MLSPATRAAVLTGCHPNFTMTTTNFFTVEQRVRIATRRLPLMAGETGTIRRIESDRDGTLCMVIVGGGQVWFEPEELEALEE